MASFFKPLLADNRKALIIWMSAGVLLTVKIYEGDQHFFVKHFGDAWEAGPMLDWMKWLYHHLASLVLFALVPIVLIKTVLKENLRDYGLQLGDWKFGLMATLAALIVMPFPVYFSSQNPEHLQFYPLTTLATASATHFVLWCLTYLPHYIGWEFFFRGYLQFGLKKHYGVAAAIMVPTILTTLMHIGKPEGETWGALIGGVYMGLLALRTRSMVWPLLFHWYMGILNSYFTGIAI